MVPGVHGSFAIGEKSQFSKKYNSPADSETQRSVGSYPIPLTPRKLNQSSNQIITLREYSTYRVITTSRLQAPRHLVVNDNLKSSQNAVKVLYKTYRACFS